MEDQLVPNKLTAKEFLTSFCKDLVRHTGNRPELIAGYTATMQARDDAIRREAKDQANADIFRLVQSSRLLSDFDRRIVLEILADHRDSIHANPETRTQA